MEIIRESSDEWWEEFEAANDRRAASKGRVRIKKCGRCGQLLASDMEPVRKRQRVASAGSNDEQEADGKRSKAASATIAKG